MTFSMAPLLVSSNDVPAHVRTALREALSAEPARREDRLRSAAHLMYEAMDLDCADVLELVGL